MFLYCFLYCVCVLGTMVPKTHTQYKKAYSLYKVHLVQAISLLCTLPLDEIDNNTNYDISVLFDCGLKIFTFDH